jgi:exodeoxyribonuclease VII large subunit
MNPTPDFNHSILDLTPATLHQLVVVQAGQLLSDQLPETLGLVRVSGILSDPGSPRGQWHYGVRLAADGAQVAVDLPASLVSGNALIAGEHVSVVGVLRLRASKLGTLELRIEAGDVQALRHGAAPQVNVVRQGRIGIEQLRSLPVSRHPFPQANGRPLHVAVVQSSSPHAQVAQDCVSELQKLGTAIKIEHLRVNILDPAAIASAIERAHADVLLLIRGGGPAQDFEVFDDPRVVTALAGKNCYRVIGLGHSGDQTLLSLVVEHSARTPAQAGLFVREVMEARAAKWHAMNEQLARTEARQGFQPAVPNAETMSVTLWWVAAVAFIVGVIVRQLA